MLLQRFVTPIRELSESGKLSGLLLVLATIISLIISNSGWGESYIHFWELPIGVPALTQPLDHWIDDGLMTIFFFMVGLEIRREVLYGELTNLRQAMLPVVAAVGGVALPAGIYLLCTHGTAASHGWAVPTATDIAFSLGILSLLGGRISLSLRLFLTALAIIDDLLAVLIIAGFYTAQIELAYLLGAALVFAGLLGLNRLKVLALPVYFVLGLVLWYCVYKSGVHATIAGVLLALTVPVASIEKLEIGLQKPVSYLILPVFALANTAIVLSTEAFSNLLTPLGLGVALGLLLGKPIGIFGATWLMVRAKLSVLPESISWLKLLGLGCTAGIGFTMSILIANLSFADRAHIDLAKLAIIIGSFLSGLLGFVVLWMVTSNKEATHAEEVVPEQEPALPNA